MISTSHLYCWTCTTLPNAALSGSVILTFAQQHWHYCCLSRGSLHACSDRFTNDTNECEETVRGRQRAAGWKHETIKIHDATKPKPNLLKASTQHALSTNRTHSFGGPFTSYYSSIHVHLYFEVFLRRKR